MSQANPIVGRVIERACAEVLVPETGAGTLTWQWTSDGALETTRNGVRIVLGVDPEHGKGPYGDVHRAAESSVLAGQIRADFGLGPMGDTERPLPGAAGPALARLMSAGAR